MGNYEVSIDAESITASGGTITGDRIVIDDRDTVAIQVEGDADSSNFDLQLQGKNGNATPNFGDLDTASFTGEDITGNTNQSKIYLYDVSGMSEVKPKIVNNNSVATTITVSVGVDTNN